MKPKPVLLSLLALLMIAAGFWGGHTFERRNSREAAEQIAHLHNAEIEASKAQSVVWADAIARGEGEAVLRAFVSGISPALLADRVDGLEIPAVGLLRVPGVAGIHVLRPDGKVVYSSDAKLTTTGRTSAEGQWALTATELVARAGPNEGTLEFALPVVNGGTVLAVVWMEFSQREVRDAARPEGGTPKAPPPEPVATEAKPVEAEVPATTPAPAAVEE